MTYRKGALATMIGMLLSGALLGPAQAGIISGVPLSGGVVVSGDGGSAVVTANAAALVGSVNNDNSAASPNTVVLSETLLLNTAIPDDALDPVDVVFQVVPSGGVTEYLFTATVKNNHPFTPWTSYRIELGFGTGASFVRSALNDGLDFDFPDRDPSPTSTIFTTMDHQSETLDFSNPTAPIVNGDIVGFSFSIDVPDISGVAFTLRQIPNFVAPQQVPEPATVLLLLLGGAGVAVMKRRHRRT